MSNHADAAKMFHEAALAIAEAVKSIDIARQSLSEYANKLACESVLQGAIHIGKLALEDADATALDAANRQFAQHEKDLRSVLPSNDTEDEI